MDKERSMKNMKKIIPLFWILCGSLASLLPSAAFAGPYVGWNVSVGGGGWYPGPYGGPWRPAGYYGGYPYPVVGYAPPVVYAAPPVYMAPPQPVVLASQPQPSVWYYCAESGKYYPYVESCAGTWKIQPALPPANQSGPSPSN